MTHGMQLDPHKLQILDAPLHLAFISVAGSMRSHTGYAEEAAWMPRAQVGNAIVCFGCHRRTWIGLHDGCIHAAFSMRRKMSSSVASRPKTQHSPRWAWVSIFLVMNPL